MVIKKLLALAILLVAVACPLGAKLNLPSKNLGKESYYYYKVEKNNQSLADIATKIGVTKEDIIKYNPTAKNGVVKNQLLFFPVNEFDKPSPQASRVNPSTITNTVTHVVKSGESVYGIAKAYGITESQLLTANPSISNGVKAGDELLIPQTPASINPEGIFYHTIEKGETLYGVAKKYNTTIENLMELNPGISGTNFRAGEAIKVKPNTTKDIVITREIIQFEPYKVQKGDTYQSIAQAHGINVNQLKEVNPDISDRDLKNGKIIYIPKTVQDQQTVNTSLLSEQQLEESYSDRLDDVYDAVHSPNHDNSIDIAIMLPFQLEMSNRSRNADNYIEFYNGFYMGLSEIGDRINKPLNINVYDTKNSIATTDSILHLEALLSNDIIIAPSEDDQLRKIMRFGRDNNINVLNCFATHSDDYINNPRAMQVNIPSSYMNAEIKDMLDTKFKDYVLVFLFDIQEPAKDIYDEILNHAQATNHQNITLTVSADFTGKTISRYLEPGSNYLFIPSNGKESFFNSFATGLREAKDMRYDCELELLGHPEYTMYIKKYKEEFMALDTYIYSRFYLPDNDQVAAFNRSYTSMFGSEPTNSTPNMSVFGYDTSLFIANALINDVEPGSKESKFNGIQTNFNFERANNWAGFINRSVRIIHLTPKKELIITDLNDK